MVEMELFDVDLVKVSSLFWELPETWYKIKPLTWSRLVHIDSKLWEVGDEVLGAATFYENMTAIMCFLKYNSKTMVCSVRVTAQDLYRPSRAKKHEDLFMSAVRSLLSSFERAA